MTPPARASRRRPYGPYARYVPYAFLFPFALLFALFFILPIGYALHQSLFQARHSGLGFGAPVITFSGLANYVDVVHDSVFWSGVGRVFLYGVVSIPVMLGLSLILALLMDSATVRFRPFLRLVFFAPYAVPGIVAALLWGFFYNPILSPIVKTAQALGLGSPNFLSTETVLWAIANISVWQWAGYNMLIIFAGLQSISPELYEAAAIDGCTGFKLARYVKIPLVAPTIVLTAIFSIIGTLQLFTEPLVMRSISTAVSTNYTPNLYAYHTAFGNNNYHYAAAMAALLAVFTFVLSFGLLRASQRYSGL